MTRRYSLHLTDLAAAVLDAVPDEASQAPVGKGGGRHSGRGAFVSKLLEEHGARAMLPGPEHRPAPPEIAALVRAYPGERTSELLTRWRALTGESGHQGKRRLLRAEAAEQVGRQGKGTATRWVPVGPAGGPA